MDTEPEALKFIQQFNITHPNGPDVGTEVSHSHRIQGVPETYFVGRDGQLYGNYIGPIDKPILTAKLDELLKK